MLWLHAMYTLYNTLPRAGYDPKGDTVGPSASASSVSTRGRDPSPGA